MPGGEVTIGPENLMDVLRFRPKPSAVGSPVANPLAAIAALPGAGPVRNRRHEHESAGDMEVMDADKIRGLLTAVHRNVGAGQEKRPDQKPIRTQANPDAPSVPSGPVADEAVEAVQEAVADHVDQTSRQIPPDAGASESAAAPTFRITRGGGWIVVHDLPVVDEHEVYDDDGNFVCHCDRQMLERIAANNNDRIRQSGDLTPITLGHTKDDAPEEEQPKIVGYGGPFYVAPLWSTGRQALFVKQAKFMERYEDKIRDYPRRSVEIWFDDNPMVDPIALLGATTPERDLGLMRLEKSGQRVRCGVIRRAKNGGRKVIYAGDRLGNWVPRPAATQRKTSEDHMAGKTKSKRNDKPAKRDRHGKPVRREHGGDSLAAYTQGGTGDDLVDRIVAAMMETAALKWVERKMHEEQAEEQEHPSDEFEQDHDDHMDALDASGASEASGPSELEASSDEASSEHAGRLDHDEMSGVESHDEHEESPGGPSDASGPSGSSEPKRHQYEWSEGASDASQASSESSSERRREEQAASEAAASSEPSEPIRNAKGGPSEGPSESSSSSDSSSDSMHHKKRRRYAAGPVGSVASDTNAYVPSDTVGGERTHDEFKNPPKTPGKMPEKGEKKGKRKMSKTAARGAAPTRRPDDKPVPADVKVLAREVTTLRVRTARIERENAELVRHNKKLHQEKTLADREGDLKGLMAEGFDLDLVEEMKDVAEMTPDQFTRHKDRIRKKYAKSITAPTDLAFHARGIAPPPSAMTKNDAMNYAKQAADANDPGLYDRLVAGHGKNGTNGTTEHVN